MHKLPILDCKVFTRVVKIRNLLRHDRCFVMKEIDD